MYVVITNAAYVLIATSDAYGDYRENIVPRELLLLNNIFPKWLRN